MLERERHEELRDLPPHAEVLRHAPRANRAVPRPSRRAAARRLRRHGHGRPGRDGAARRDGRRVHRCAHRLLRRRALRRLPAHGRSGRHDHRGRRHRRAPRGHLRGGQARREGPLRHGERLLRAVVGHQGHHQRGLGRHERDRPRDRRRQPERRRLRHRRHHLGRRERGARVPQLLQPRLGLPPWRAVRVQEHLRRCRRLLPELEDSHEELRQGDRDHRRLARAHRRRVLRRRVPRAGFHRAADGRPLPDRRHRHARGRLRPRSSCSVLSSRSCSGAASTAPS